MTPTVLTPVDAASVRDCVLEAAASGNALSIRAGGSKRDFGQPVDAYATLDVSGLTGILDYEPAELFLTAKAGTPLADIEAVLRPHRQMLAFEPPDWRGIYGVNSQQTLGGVVACNLAGPRRVRAGAARDHFLGFAAVNGRGEIWKAGGRVVKNVTGYDMCKLQAGAFGTLSVLTEITMRLLPSPETTSTVLVPGLTEADAVRLMSDALNTPHEVSAASHLPADIAALASPGGDGVSLTALRLEGHAPSVTFRRQAVARSCPGAVFLDDADSQVLWRMIGDAGSLLPAGDAVIWRLCTAPSRSAELVTRLRARFADLRAIYDWGGGLVWIALTTSDPNGGAGVVRDALSGQGGHATLVRAPEAVRARVNVFQPMAPGLTQLAARVKAGFDPLGILNPKRMHRDF